jgi:type IV pilus biogenesis protein CpaD/CtpE
MAMCSIEIQEGPMTSALKPLPGLIALAAAGALLGGCASNPVESRLRLSDDFGQAVRQDLAAQIADPDPAWKNQPPPASNGARAALAQTRYQKNAVIPPSIIGASGSAPGYGANSAGAGASTVTGAGGSGAPGGGSSGP